MLRRIRRPALTVSALSIVFLLAPAPSVESAPVALAPARSLKAPELGAARAAVAKRHILVELRHGTDIAAFRQQARAAGFQLRGRVYGSNWFTMSIPANLSPRAAANLARGLIGVARATPDPIVYASTHRPNAPHDLFYIDDDDPSTKDCDPFIEPCAATQIVDQWGLFQVEAETAGWSVETGSDQVIIAVVDSGVDFDHDDLVGKTVPGWDFVGANVGDPFTDNPDSQDPIADVPSGGQWIFDGVSFPLGWYFDGDPAVGDGVDNDFDFAADVGVFHGTFVAGIIAALTDNKLTPEASEYEGIAGACWNCKIMPIRVINAEGWAYASAAAAGIRFAADNGARVINASWGIDINGLDAAALAEIQILAQAIDYAVSHGVIVIAAAGNSGTAGVHYPATRPDVIAVGSSDWLDQRSGFSTTAGPAEIPDNGSDDDGNGWVDDIVDVLAPGELTWSTGVVGAYDTWILNGWLFEPEPGAFWQVGDDAYMQANGTSFSTPLVAGYVGLLLSQNPTATFNQIRQIVRSNTFDIYTPGYDAESGFGRLRMVVPASLPPDTNQSPVANAGPDQTVQDRGKPGEEAVTLDGSGSYDPDGTITSYQWFEGNVRIASGVTPTVLLAPGTHAVTLQVSDNGAATHTDAVVIDVLAKSGGGGGPKNNKANGGSKN